MTNFNIPTPAPPCVNDPVNGNVAALAAMSNGTQKANESAGGNQSLMSGISSGAHAPGDKKHNVG